MMCELAREQGGSAVLIYGDEVSNWRREPWNRIREEEDARHEELRPFKDVAETSASSLSRRWR